MENIPKQGDQKENQMLCAYICADWYYLCLSVRFFEMKTL